MVLIFGAAFLYAILAMVMGMVNFWCSIALPIDVPGGAAAIWQAIKDAGQLRYLDGGGVGCFNDDDQPVDRRRLYHHLTFYGFMLCFASTSVATLYHYGLGRVAPYAWWDLPPVLGTIGGIGLLIGPVGRWRRNGGAIPRSRARRATHMSGRRWRRGTATPPDLSPR